MICSIALKAGNLSGAKSAHALNLFSHAQEYCGGGELYGLLMAQPKKRLPEAHMRFYAAEVLLALQYLHLLGFVYRCACSLVTVTLGHNPHAFACSACCKQPLLGVLQPDVNSTSYCRTGPRDERGKWSGILLMRSICLRAGT